MRPVMWAGIVMMTLVAGALAYFGQRCFFFSQDPISAE